MATDIGPRIGIEGEAEYRKQIQEITQAQRTLKAEMTATAAAFDEDASAKQKSAQTSKILQQQIGTTNQKLKEQEAMLAEASAKYGEADKRTLAWKETVEKTKAELARLNKELKANSGVVAFGKDMEAAGKKMKEAGTKIGNVGRTLSRTVTAPLVAAGAAAVKLAADFETSIAKLETIADTTEKPISKLTEEIMKLSDETGIAASEISEQAYQAISAGQSTANAVNFVANATKLAKAGFTEAGSALDVLTTILNAYGKSGAEAADVSDKLIKTQNLGKVTVAQLSESMGKAIPTAASYGVNLDNVAATYVTLTKQGIKADVATTQLNGIMNQLGKSGTKAANALKDKTGKTFKQLMEGGASLSDVLKIVAEAADENGVALNDMFGNIRASAGALAIMNDGGETFTKTLEEMQTAAGSTDRAFKKMTETTAYKFEISLNRVKNAGIEAGQQLLIVLAPTIEKITNLIDRGAKAFENMSKDEQQAILKTLGFAAAIGPATQVLGGLTRGIGAMTQSCGKMIQIWGMTGKIPVSSMMGIAGAALALNAALAQMYTHTVQAGNEILRSADNTKEAAAKAKDLREEIEGSTKAYKKNTDEIDDNGKKADKLAKRIEELTSKTKRSASEQRQLEAAVEELNDIYPTLNLQINAQTGALNKSNAEIQENIKNLREQARAQAAQERAVELNRQIIDTEIKLEELHGRTAQAAQDVADANRAMAEESEKYGKVSGRTKITVDEATAAEQALNEEIAAQENSLAQLQGQLEITEGYLGTHSEALAANTEAQEAAAAATDETVEALEAEAAAAEATAQKMVENATLQAGAFEKVEQAQTVSIQKIIEGLESQVKAQQNYRSNLEKLNSYIQKDTEHNWDAVIKIIQDGGIGMAGELQGIVDAIESGDEDALAALAELTVGIGSETQASGKALGELSTIAKTKISDAAIAIRQTSPKVQTEAKLSAEGMRTGWKTGAASAGALMVTDTQTTMNKPKAQIAASKPGIRSESQKAAEEMGPGFEAGAKNAEGKASSGAKGVTGAAERGLKDGGKSLNSTAKGVGSDAGQAVADGANDKVDEAKTAGGNLTNGLANGIEAKKQYLIQKAREAAAAALREFKNVPEISSPSKVTTKYGEYIDLGYAKGMDNKIGVIRAAGRRAANAAIEDVGGQKYIDMPTPSAMDPDRLYAAVKEGAQNAVPKIYLGSRELTRSLQDMGVAFTYG